MSEEIPPTPEALAEALLLSDDILKDIELSRVPLTTAALKASRLARLLNHFDAQQIFHCEASGYPTTPGGVRPEIWRLLELAGRTYQQRDPTAKEAKTLAFLESIEQLEHQIEAGKVGLEAAQDRDVSVSSANPTQFVMAPMGNFLERQSLHGQISTAAQRLASRRALIYDYASCRHYELKFSGVAQNVFSAVRESVDRSIGEVVPEAVRKFASVHDNLRSQNPEERRSVLRRTASGSNSAPRITSTASFASRKTTVIRRGFRTSWGHTSVSSATDWTPPLRPLRRVPTPLCPVTKRTGTSSIPICSWETSLAFAQGRRARPSKAMERTRGETVWSRRASVAGKGGILLFHA